MKLWYQYSIFPFKQSSSKLSHCPHLHSSWDNGPIDFTQKYSFLARDILGWFGLVSVLKVNTGNWRSSKYLKSIRKISTVANTLRAMKASKKAQVTRGWASQRQLNYAELYFKIKILVWVILRWTQKSSLISTNALPKTPQSPMHILPPNPSASRSWIGTILSFLQGKCGVRILTRRHRLNNKPSWFFSMAQSDSSLALLDPISIKQRASKDNHPARATALKCTMRIGGVSSRGISSESSSTTPAKASNFSAIRWTRLLAAKLCNGSFRDSNLHFKSPRTISLTQSSIDKSNQGQMCGTSEVTSTKERWLFNLIPSRP